MDRKRIIKATDNDIHNQLDYLARQFSKLRDLCAQEREYNETLLEIRNLTEDIILRANRLVDQILFNYWKKKIAPSLTPQEVEKYERKIQFPLTLYREKLEELFPPTMKKTREEYPDLFKLIEKFQPYHEGNRWIMVMRKLSNLAHRRLIPQKRTKLIHLTLREEIHYVGESIEMENATLGGIPNLSFAIKDGKIVGNIDPHLKPRVETWVSYHIEDTLDNAEQICRDIIIGLCDLSQEMEDIMD